VRSRGSPREGVLYDIVYWDPDVPLRGYDRILRVTESAAVETTRGQ
jgi:hypothetical protein